MMLEHLRASLHMTRETKQWTEITDAVTQGKQTDLRYQLKSSKQDTASQIENILSSVLLYNNIVQTPKC